MNKNFSVVINKKIKKFNKKIKIPEVGDKSCSIRALIFASQCIGTSRIKNLLESEDVLNCVEALKTLGVKIIRSHKGLYYTVYGNGLNSYKTSNKIKKIWLGNSGTTVKILAGLLATQPGKFLLTGDPSLQKRNMSRIISPLEKVGAFFYPEGKKTLPLMIEGTAMPLAQNHIENIGSASVKSCLLASFLSCPGISTITELKPSRSHTEIILKKIGADIKIKKLKKGNLITLKGQKNLHSFNYTVSPDPSSVAFLVAITLLTPDSKLVIKKCLLNNTRLGFYKLLKEKAKANIKVLNSKRSSENGEFVGTIVVKSSSLKPINCPKELVPSLIDELPILFVIASLSKGVAKFNSIGELANKESPRATEMQKILTQVGIVSKITKNTMTIYGGKNKIKNNNKSILVKTKHDHRILMSGVIMSLLTGINAKIKNFETVSTSFPSFIKLVRLLGGKIEIKKN